MRYIVTGGAGFIGSNLVDILIERGDEVIVIDNLATGKKENLNPRAKFIEADICDYEKIASHFTGADGVFHLAALPRVQLSIEKPVETHRANVLGTINVLIAARDNKIKRVVYSASSSAYGGQLTLPLKEEMTPYPMSPYGLQKLEGEEYCRLFSELFGLETVCLRYFNVYGPRMADEGSYVTVIAIFLRQKKNGEKLTVTGDGTQTRDFTHVADVARANLAAMESGKVGKGEVINIGSGSNKSVNEVAALAGGDIEYIPARKGEPHDTLADISRAKLLLEWEPKEDFEERVKGLIK